jgi:two-component system response regulator RegA
VESNERDRDRLISDLRRLDVQATALPAPAVMALAPPLRQELIIVDGDATGLPDLVGRLRRLAPAAHLVVLAGYPSYQTSFAAARAGANNYLLKPVSGAQILQCLLAQHSGREPATLPSLERHRREYIDWVLERHGGNKTHAARSLGIPRYTLQRILSRYPPVR